MSFFRLPAELRDMVYKHIVAGHGIKMDPQTGRSAVAPPAGFATLQLISRQVHKESIAIYYDFNNFWVPCDGLTIFLDTVGQQ